jgi:hypothetical protein
MSIEFRGHLDECDRDLQRSGVCFPCVHYLKKGIREGGMSMEFRGHLVSLFAIVICEGIHGKQDDLQIKFPFLLPALKIKLAHLDVVKIRFASVPMFYPDNRPHTITRWTLVAMPRFLLPWFPVF